MRKNGEKYKIFLSYCNINADDAEAISGPLSTVLASMLPELHAFKVLFYAESVSVVTSGHMTKMAVTPFDPQFPKTPCYTLSSRLFFIEPELLPIEVLHCGNREFRVFFAKK